MKTRIPTLALLAAALGCAQSNLASLEFRGICTNPLPTTSGCLYTSPCPSYALGTYWYDPTVASDLLVPIEMFNQLPNNADASAGRVNTNDAIIQQWRLEILYGGTLVTSANAQENLVVAANSHQVALVPVFPVSVLPLMAMFPGTEFTVNVRAAGRYLDERIFESGPFKVPAATKTWSAPITCTAPAVVEYCPQAGQAGSAACITP